jgi:APA family basic amino acid/polyamine antiporter
LKAAHLFRRKAWEEESAPGDGDAGGAPSLRRTLGALDLTLLGVGAIVGAGIFSSVGQMAAGGPDHPAAGPALILSFVITAVACGFSALCYAEIAALVPASGSAYTYAFVALGELPAWIIGWDLIIEYAVGNIYVAQSWADYFRSCAAAWGSTSRPGWRRIYRRRHMTPRLLRLRLISRRPSAIS